MNYQILFVDDELNVLRSIKRELRKENYNILTATSGKEGLRLLKQHPVSVVVSDQRMPEMTGTEFLSQVRKLYPDTIRVVLSGYADASVILEATNEGDIYRFLTKPWKGEELRVNMRLCLDHYAVVEQNTLLTKALHDRNEELLVKMRQIENLMDIKKQTLEYTQEIVHRLPMPIVGIDSDNSITLINSSAENLFADNALVSVGMNADSLLPENEESAKLNAEQEEKYSLNGETLKVRHLDLSNQQSVRGGLLIWEPVECQIFE